MAHHNSNPINNIKIFSASPLMIHSPYARIGAAIHVIIFYKFMEINLLLIIRSVIILYNMLYLKHTTNDLCNDDHYDWLIVD